MKVTIKDLEISHKNYHKDKEKQETILVGIDYANVTIKTENVCELYEFQNEYSIIMNNGKIIHVSKEDFENVKSLY